MKNRIYKKYHNTLHFEVSKILAMVLLFIISSLSNMSSAQADTPPEQCKAKPKIVFILDDSSSIDNTERKEMGVALTKIANGIKVDYPNALFGVVQYGSPPPVTTPESGFYNIIMGYTNTPNFTISNDFLMAEDHLPDSLYQMMDDNIFSKGNKLDNPDAFFIFTDAARHFTGHCCSVLENTGKDESSNALPGFGEYSKLATLANTGNVSIYQVIYEPGDSSPEIAQGNGVHNTGNFSIAQGDIDDITANICTTVPTTPTCNTALNFEAHTLESASGTEEKVGAIYRFYNVTTDVDALVEILAISNAEIRQIDDTSSGALSSLQVELLMDNNPPIVTVPDQHVDFEIRFVKAGTTTPVILKTVHATAVDIDGDQGGSREYTILPNADSYTLEDPTDLTSPSRGHFTSITPGNTPGIAITNFKSMATAHYSDVSSIRYTTGFTNDGTDYKTWHRQSSLSFECVTYPNPKEPEVAGQCYAMSDKASQLYTIDLDLSTKIVSTNLPKLLTGEGMAYRAADNALYAFHQDSGDSSLDPSDLYRVELDGNMTLVKKDYVNTSVEGAEFIKYSTGAEHFLLLTNEDKPTIQIFDALNFDNNTPIETITLVFPAGHKTQGVIGGIAVNPTTGEVLMVTDYNNPGDISKIYSVNMLTGVLTVKVTIKEQIDSESFSFASDGFAYTESDDEAITGSGPGDTHRIYRINLDTGAITLVDRGELSGDIEGMACTGNVIPPPPPPAEKCYAMNDDNANLYKFDLDLNTSPITIKMDRKFNGEGAAYRATDNALYAFEDKDLYKVTLDGKSTLIANNFLPDPSAGAEFVSYTNGDERFLVLVEGKSPNIYIYDATKLAQKIPLQKIELINPDNTHAKDLDGLAVNPTTGEVLVIKSRYPNYIKPIIYTVNMNTGVLTKKVTLNTKSVDAESFAFASDGYAYTESDDGAHSGKGTHRINKINLSTGALTLVEEANLSGDIESLACMGSVIKTPTPPSISGIVFKDDNTNDIYDASESGIANISISLYNDINKDGKIDGGDTLVSTLNSDVDGKYTFNNLTDGEYLVQVDSSDGDLGIGLIVGGTNPLAITINGNAVTNADFPFDEVVCTAFSGEISEAALISPAQINSSDRVIVPSTSVTPNEIQGHLRAYDLDAKGVPKTKAKWDADEKMTEVPRQARLYSTKEQGKKHIALFNTLKETLFETSVDDSNIIKNYTFDPSYDNGKYLAGRKSKSFLGGISRNNGIALLNGAMDTFQYLGDTDYQSYYSKYVVKRDEKVLLGSDDGFLYSFDYETGELAWGWMPESLVKELKAYTTFQSNKFMRGQINVLDLKASGKYDPYVVGSYKGGLGHYVLKLKKTSTSKSKIDSVVWESDLSDSYVSSPNNGQMEYFTDDKGNTYAAYAMTNSSNKSTLFIQNLTDSKKVLEVSLDFNITSTPYVMQDFKKYNAPARKTIYVGDEKGNLYSAKLLTSKGELNTASIIKASLSKSIAALNASETDPLHFIGASVSITGKGYYLRAQSETRLSVFKYDYGFTKWKRVWSSYIKGSGKWDSSGSHTSNPSTIQSLPDGATITDNAYIVADSIVLPVNIPDTTGVLCYGKAYYYLYKLSDGSFPKHIFYGSNNIDISGNIELGLGKATRLVLSDLPGKDVLAAFGHAEQKKDNTTGVNDTFFVRDTMTTGVRSWRILEDVD